MDNIFELIPQNKFDFTSIEELKCIDPNDVVPILEGLMEWMQDLNWPVAQELIKILPRFHVQLIPVIRKIIDTNDDIWKLWTLELMKGFPRETLLMFQPELRRMEQNPSEGEKNEEVDICANEILQLIS